jgi:hypothetical protein
MKRRAATAHARQRLVYPSPDCNTIIPPAIALDETIRCKLPLEEREQIRIDLVLVDVGQAMRRVWIDF